MKKSLLAITAIGLITFCGCESKAGTGAIVGGVVGAGTGALIGGAPGAAIGAGAGIVGGAVVGAALDSSDRNRIEQRSPDTMRRYDRNQKLNLNDIKSLSQSGISNDKIIGMIQQTNSHYNLTTSQVIELKNAGVSQKVIDYMINYT